MTKGDNVSQVTQSTQSQSHSSKVRCVPKRSYLPGHSRFLGNAEKTRWTGAGQLDILVEQTIVVETDGQIEKFKLFVVESKRHGLEVSDALAVEAGWRRSTADVVAILFTCQERKIGGSA